VPEPLVTIDEARARVLKHCDRRLGEETVTVEQALGRVLAADVLAAGDVPPFPSSAMDGYALPEGTAGRYAVTGEARAGTPHEGTLAAGTAIRISTGAAVPAGTFAVIRQEDVRAGEDGTIETLVAVRADANVRAAGEDMRTGATILTAGRRLGPAELGAAVAAGAGALAVARRPLVRVVCTGDELRAPGEPLGPGEIHNSNGPMLVSLAVRRGALAPAAERLPDDPGRTEAILAEALQQCDVLVVCGGVSVGPHDHVKPALEALGVEQHFWGVALQPGKPTWFGTRGRRLVFALPGNPVSAAVTFTLFARPALDALQGALGGRSLVPEARLARAFARNRSRDQAIRVRLEPRDGGYEAVPTGAQDSHLFSSLLAADALAIIPRGEGELAPGTPVRLEPAPG
jgi:molybdopterin molybdotransferase